MTFERFETFVNKHGKLMGKIVKGFSYKSGKESECWIAMVRLEDKLQVDCITYNLLLNEIDIN